MSRDSSRLGPVGALQKSWVGQEGPHMAQGSFWLAVHCMPTQRECRALLTHGCLISAIGADRQAHAPGSWPRAWGQGGFSGEVANS